MASEKKRADTIGKMRTGPVKRGTGPKIHPPVTWALPKPPGVGSSKNKQDNRPEKWLKGPNWIVVRGTGPKTHPPITWTLPKPPGSNPPKDEQASESR